MSTFKNCTIEFAIFKDTGQSYGSFFPHPVVWPDVRSCHSPVRGGHLLQKHWRSVRWWEWKKHLAWFPDCRETLNNDGIGIDLGIKYLAVYSDAVRDKNINKSQPVAFSPIIFELTFWHIAHILTVAKECGEIPWSKTKALRVPALGAFLLVTVSYSV